MPDAMPRERCGQLSIASGVPAAHSPPMPRPNSRRKAKNHLNVGARPLIAENIEKVRIEIISGSLRPTRSPKVPKITPPKRRQISVPVMTVPIATRPTPKVLLISPSTNTRRK